MIQPIQEGKWIQVQAGPLALTQAEASQGRAAADAAAGPGPGTVRRRPASGGQWQPWQTSILQAAAHWQAR